MESYLMRSRSTGLLGVLAFLLRGSGRGGGVGVTALVPPVPASTVPRGGGSIRCMSSRPTDAADPSPSSPRPYEHELFSVAPMMGHTNRHYHYFFRLLSKKSHLYTEMLPSAQIFAAYRRAREIYLPNLPPSSAPVLTPPHPEEVMEVVTKLLANPSLEYASSASQQGDIPLHHLLAIAPPTSGAAAESSSIVLQLGGRNQDALAAASAIGSAWGMASASAASASSTSTSSYASINLNCGCPSNAVGGRNGGCALMETPDLVARGVEAMQQSVEEVWRVDHDGSGGGRVGSPPTITVKHRLGARDAATFDAQADRRKNDDEAVAEASSFVRTVSLTGAVPKFHVHTRLGLLGDFADDDDEDDDTGGTGGGRKRQRQKLWVPGSNVAADSTSTDENGAAAPRVKVDHKREQEKARRRARRDTIKNREVPPLRPGVVGRLADEFPGLDFVANGGIHTLGDVKQIVDSTSSGGARVMGGMVGRSVINHPCSFAAADDVLWGESSPSNQRPTRGDVLQEYIRYCDDEEERISGYGASPNQMEALRRRLVAVPFHLFTGEEGGDKFQRRIKKLKLKTSGIRASSILGGAASFVPQDTMDKSVDDFVAWEDIARFEGGLKRGSALQRVVY